MKENKSCSGVTDTDQGILIAGISGFSVNDLG
jgi:hypothetical protein